jgi:PAS domain S-box-containing protein
MMTDANRLSDMGLGADDAICAAIVHGAADAIVLADRDGAIRLWNGAAERIFGFRADEAMGRSLDLIIPEKLRARHWEGYREVMRTGRSRYSTELLSVPALRKDGERISVEFTVSLLSGADGAPSGIAAILRDTTERRRRDQELQKRLAALEGRKP